MSSRASRRAATRRRGQERRATADAAHALLPKPLPAAARVSVQVHPISADCQPDQCGAVYTVSAPAESAAVSLRRAAADGDTERLQSCLHAAALWAKDAQDDEGCTALHLAALGGHSAACAVLLAAGACGRSLCKSIRSAGGRQQANRLALLASDAERCWVPCAPSLAPACGACEGTTPPPRERRDVPSRRCLTRSCAHQV